MTTHLEILVCTIDEGIKRIPHILCQPISSVSYLISWQQSADNVRNIPIPEELTQRNDVKIITLKGKGLSANRNNAIKNATGDILLLSDDDTRYNETYLNTIIKSFQEFPQADIITFRGVNYHGELIRSYSDTPYEYKQRPRFSYVCSWEIAFRNLSNIPLFDTRFGLGAEFLCCGEEEVFIHQASLKGLTILYIPRTIVSTNDNTTGKQFFTNERVRYSKGAVMMLFHGFLLGSLKCLKCALSASKFNMKRMYIFFRDMYKGMIYIRKTDC